MTDENENNISKEITQKLDEQRDKQFAQYIDAELDKELDQQSQLVENEEERQKDPPPGPNEQAPEPNPPTETEPTEATPPPGTGSQKPKLEWRRPPELPAFLILNLLTAPLGFANRLLILSLSLFYIIMFVFNDTDNNHPWR